MALPKKTNIMIFCRRNAAIQSSRSLNQGDMERPPGSGDSGGWPGVARATPESSLATPVATPDLIGSWSSSSTQEIREMLSINDDS